MSKNVAVFVDVANIFYAAKAAGVDIDYVTLLKAASAGRDLVRAYAYTGLDPENENQRQFHAFLARNGYRVVSKDIRKYGDGKVKANLDIELVVDLMRTSRNLDIAVVVSGDGDFAPAIRAVQQTGVRVEVISFRGNTSSDLIDVADVFTDITQIARVERSSRSGRRVAAEEGDLSMTEVPEKETEGASRRRWGRRGEGREEARRDERRTERRERQPVVAAAVMATTPSGMPLVVLPGEKLSKVAAVAPPPSGEEVLAAEETEETEELVEVGSVQSAAPESQGQEIGRRRRRRRGGRGRGRGRGQEAVGEAANIAEPGLPGEEGEGEEELEPEAPRIPPHSAFGSVWDSQLGMPTAPVAGTADLDEEELEEPEIPEYLLTERRQRGRATRAPRGTRGGRGSAYQQAVERERYGRGAPGSVSSSGRAPRAERSPERGARPQFERQERARPPREPQPEPRQQSGAEPWSEVPPDVAELLRAELARRGGAAQEEAERGQAPAEGRAPEGGTQPPTAVRSPGGTRGRGGRGRTRSDGSSEAPAAARAEVASATEPGGEPSGAGRGESGVVAAAPPAAATASRGRRRASRVATGETLQVAGTEAAATAGELVVAEGAETKPVTARRRDRTVAPSAAVTGMSGATDGSAGTRPEAGSAGTQPGAAGRPRGRRTGSSSTESAGAETVGTGTAAPTGGEPPTRRRRTPQATAGQGSEGPAEAAQRSAEGDEPASPARRRTRRMTPASES